MKLTYDLKWGIGRRWGRRETPPKHLALYKIANLLFALCLILFVSLAWGRHAGSPVSHLVKYTAVACGLLSLWILIADMVAEWKRERSVNLFSCLLTIGWCLCLVFVVFNRYFLSLIA